MTKTIGVEVVRTYKLQVPDDLDTHDWLSVGLLLQETGAEIESIDLLAWDLPDEDLDSEISVLNEEMARRRRLRDAIASFDWELSQRGKLS